MTSYLTVNSIECTECQQWDNFTYDATNSTTSDFNTATEVTIDFGDFEATGFRGHDRVCWQNQSDICVQDVQFIEVSSYSPGFIPPITEHFAGFFGMNPINTGLGWYDAPSFIE